MQGYFVYVEVEKYAYEHLYFMQWLMYSKFGLIDLGSGEFGTQAAVDLSPPNWDIQLVESFGPNLPLLVKLHEIWSVNSHENH